MTARTVAWQSRLAEKTFAKGVGARVNLISNGLPAEFVLFGEDASRILLSCDPEKVSRIQQMARRTRNRRRRDRGNDSRAAGN